MKTTKLIPILFLFSFLFLGCDKESNLIETGTYSASKITYQESFPPIYNTVEVTVSEKIGNNKVYISTDEVGFKFKIGKDKNFNTSSASFNTIEGNFIGSDSLVIHLDKTPSIHDGGYYYYCKKK